MALKNKILSNSGRNYVAWALAIALLLFLPMVALAVDSNAKSETSMNSPVTDGTTTAANENMEATNGTAEEVKEEVAEAQQTINNAEKALKAAMGTENRIPEQALANATGIAIFPDLTKASFVIGGRYGQGVLLLKQQGKWTGPLFVSLYGASVGAQMGVEQTDLFMIFNNDKSLEAFKDGTLTLGAEASVAAGEWGNKVGATTEADVLVYKHTAGLYAGASLSGAILEMNEETNQKFYSAVGNGGTYSGYNDVVSGKDVPETKEGERLILLIPVN